MKEKLRRFMMGRYGIDEFGKFLMIFSYGAYFVILFIRNKTLFTVLNILFWGPWIYALYRVFSKNIYKRYEENQWFLRNTVIPRRWLKMKKLQFKDKYNRYYLCPNCHQMVRVPKGRGTIEITCPSCHNRFSKRS